MKIYTIQIYKYIPTKIYIQYIYKIQYKNIYKYILRLEFNRLSIDLKFEGDERMKKYFLFARYYFFLFVMPQISYHVLYLY